MGIEITPPGIDVTSAGGSAGSIPVIEPATTPQNATAAVNTAVTITVAGVAGASIRLAMLSWSYSAAPTAGRVTVQDGATTVLDLDVGVSGFDQVPLPPGGIKMSVGNSCVVTLAAAGAAVIGKLNVATFTGA